MKRLYHRSLGLLLLCAAALVILAALGDLRASAAPLLHLQPAYLLVGLLAVWAYEAIQCLQWYGLLGALGVRAPLRAQVGAYLLGQPARVLPIGNFAQNGLLLRAAGVDVGRSSAATLMSVLLEVAIALAGLVALGLGPWGWVRPLILGGSSACALGAWVVYRWGRWQALFRWVDGRRRLRPALSTARQFHRGATALWRPKVVARAAALGAVYLLLGGTLLYLALRGLGETSIPWPQALAAYFFGVAAALILPLPVDLGVSEAGGVGALVALGAVLLVRALSLGGALVLALGAWPHCAWE